MSFRRVLVLFLVWTVMVTANAQPSVQVPARYASLIGATNYVQGLRAKTRPIELHEVATATSLACAGLRELRADKEFFERMKVAISKAPDPNQMHELRSNVNVFLESFLVPEIGILQAGGLSTDAVIMIVRDSHDLRSDLYIGKFADQVGVYQQALGKFTDEICVIARDVKEQEKKIKKDQFDRIGRGLGGFAICVIDVGAAAAPTPVAASGLGVFLANLSCAWGLPFVQDAIKESRR